MDVPGCITPSQQCYLSEAPIVISSAPDRMSPLDHLAFLRSPAFLAPCQQPPRCDGQRAPWRDVLVRFAPRGPYPTEPISCWISSPDRDALRGAGGPCKSG